MKETEKSNNTDNTNKNESKDKNIEDIFPKSLEEFLQPHENKKIEKLHNFRIDFNNKLKIAVNDFLKKSENEKLHSMEKRSYSQRDILNKNNTLKKQKVFQNFLLQKQEPWKPTYVFNRYFEKFKKLHNEHELNNWEIFRIKNFIPRTYEKINNLPQKKEFSPQKMRNDSFDNLFKENKSLFPLGNYGKKLIETFKNQNSKREKILREKEELLWKYKHSKPPIFINPWKATNHENEYFSFVPIDKVYSFKIEKKEKNLLHSSPFLPQRKIGDYFYERTNKIINQNDNS